VCLCLCVLCVPSRTVCVSVRHPENTDKLVCIWGTPMLWQVLPIDTDTGSTDFPYAAVPIQCGLPTSVTTVRRWGWHPSHFAFAENKEENCTGLSWEPWGEILRRGGGLLSSLGQLKLYLSVSIIYHYHLYLYLELQRVVSCLEDAGNQTRVFGKSNKCP